MRTDTRTECVLAGLGLEAEPIFCLLAFRLCRRSTARKDTASASLRAQGAQTFRLRSQARAETLRPDLALRCPNAVLNIQGRLQCFLKLRGGIRRQCI